MTKDRTAYPSETADKYVVRFPDGMRDMIAAAAKRNQRTMNAEIVSRLAASFASGAPEQPGQDTTGGLYARVLALEKLAPLLEKMAPTLAALERMKPALEAAERFKLPPDLDQKLQAMQAFNAKLKR